LNISKKYFEESKKYIPGGVNSPVRAFKNVGMDYPLFIKKAYGSKIVDVEDKEYIDYVLSWGPMILGHKDEDVINGIKDIIEFGTSFGAPTKLELDLAKLICDLVSSIEKVRMVSSGTEAVMSAIRLARGFTGKDKIIKFEGCYHGHSDGLLVKAGSGALTSGIPDSGGVPYDFAKNTLTATYNDIESVENLFKQNKDEIAAVVIEPVAGNMGVVLPYKSFLKDLRDITNKYNSLLIFDEVITGFRLSTGGAQEIYNVKPDLTTLGKIIGGGMPVGAFGGRADIMDFLSPEGSVYQAGTLSGNPVAMTAGIKTLEKLKNNKYIYEELENKTKEIERAFLKSSKKYNIPVSINRIGSLLSIFFNYKKIKNYSDVISSSKSLYKKYFKNMLEYGIYFAPSPYEAMFLSYAHTKKDIETTIDAVDKVLSVLK
jgi:glutamate-1-semialdehyde 2,1-aminomutase